MMIVNQRLRFTVCTLLFIALFCGLAFGCTAFSPIVGKWQDTRTAETIEFTAGGDVIVQSGGFVMTGKYELVGSNVVKLRLEGLAGAFMSAFGGDTWQYKISGDTMTVTAAGKSSVLKRSSSSPQLTLATSITPPNGGSVSPSGGTYNKGAGVTLVATPANYYKFNGWAGEISGNNNPVTIRMDSNKNIVATFTKIIFSLHFNVDNPGSGTIAQSSGNYEAGTQVKVTAASASGFRFDHWGGSISGNTNTVSVLVDTNKTITAYFTRQYSLKASSNPVDAGSINPGTGLYDADSKVKLSATPSFPYYFKNWIGADNNNTNPTTVTMMADTSVTAIFDRSVVKGKTQKVSGVVCIDGNGRWVTLASIPIQLNQFDWVQGEIIFQTPNTPNTPVRAYIQDPAGNMVKDFGSMKQTNFNFMAQTAGRYTVVFQNNSIWYADYTFTYTVYGIPQ